MCNSGNHGLLPVPSDTEFLLMDLQQDKTKITQVTCPLLYPMAFISCVLLLLVATYFISLYF